MELAFNNNISFIKEKTNNATFSLLITPGSTTDKINILFVLPNIELTSFSIYDTNGKIISELYKGFFQSGQNEIELDLPYLSNGTYLLSITAANNIVSKLFTINK